MTRLLVPFLLSWFAFSGGASSAVPDDVPRLEFDTIRRDFGTLEAGSEVHHDFSFRVVGEGALTIRRLHVSCGCTVPALTVGGEPYEPGTPIPSGASGSLRVKLKTLDGEARRNSTISLYTDPPPSQVELSVTGYVTPFFDVTPAFVNFEEVLAGEAATREIVVRAARPDADLELGEWGLGRILRPVPTDDKGLPTISEEEMAERERQDAFGLDPKPEHLRIEAEKLEAGGYRLRVHVGAGMPEGPFLLPVRFQTNLDLPVNFRVQGVIVPRVGTDPPTLLAFGLLRRGSTLEKEATVVDRDPAREVRVLGVELVDCPVKEHLHLELDTPVEGAAGRVRVRVLETLPRGAFQGVIRIRTDHPEYPTRDLKVSGFAR